MKVLILLFVLLLSVLPAFATIYPIYQFDGDPLGVTDSTGHQILPNKYSRIRYLGHGLYLACDIASGLAEGKNLYLFDRDGAQIEVKTPPKSTFAGVYSFGVVGDKEPATEIFRTLPSDSLVVFSEEEKFGLCNLDGDVILPANFGTIDCANGGLPLIFEKQTYYTYPDRECYFHSKLDLASYKKAKAYSFDVAKRELVAIQQTGIFAVAPEYSNGYRSFAIAERPHCLIGFIDTSAQVKIAPQFHRITEFDGDQALATIFDNATCGHRFVIDKTGKQISPKNLWVSSKWNGVYYAHLGTFGHSTRLINERFETIVEPPPTMIHKLADGTFLMGHPKDASILNIVSNTGKVVKTLSKSDLNEQLVLFRAVSKRDAAMSKAEDKAVFNCSFWRFKKIADKGLLFAHTPLNMEFHETEASMPIPSEIAAAIVPNIALAKCEEDRFITKPRFGSTGFDSAAFEWRNNPIHGTKVNSLIHVSKLELFIRCLKEHDLFAMSRKQVCDLLPERQQLSTSKAFHRISLINGGCCTDSYFYIDIHFDGDKVVSWNFLDGVGRASKRFTEDVVFVPEVYRQQ